MSIREQVLEQIIDVMRAARDKKQDDISAAKAAFPGTPETVIWGAWAELDHRTEEEWWKAVERTIDGEIIRNALAKGGAS